MSRLFLGLALLPCMAPTQAAEVFRYRFNGLEVQATYARGSEAQRLVAKFLQTSPRAPGGAPAGWATQGTWRQIAAFDVGVSRVLQLRGEGAELEAIASALDTRQPPRRESAPPLWLPPASVLTSQVQFLHPTASTQWVVRSAWHPQALQSWLRFSARLRGWSLDASPAPSGLQLSRDRERLQVDVLPERGSQGRGSVVVLTSWSAH